MRLRIGARARADRYLDDIYAVFGRIAAGRHFIVYDRVDDKVVVLTVPHQVRDIERISAAMGPEFLVEIQAIRDRGAGEAR